MSARLAGLALSLYLVTQAPGCGSTPSKPPPDLPGVVVSRQLVGTGVILRIRHDNGKTRDHAYDTRQPGCVAGAPYPGCLR